MLAARPHLFLANNLHFLLSFARDKVGSLSAVVVCTATICIVM